MIAIKTAPKQDSRTTSFYYQVLVVKNKNIPDRCIITKSYKVLFTILKQQGWTISCSEKVGAIAHLLLVTAEKIYQCKQQKKFTASFSHKSKNKTFST
jgi:hypothetical protein